MKLPDDPSQPDVIVAAHRGIWGGELGDGPPENSERAIEKARTDDFDIVEMDVMLTKDNKIVISHDYILGRLSDADPLLADSCWFNAVDYYYYNPDGDFWSNYGEHNYHLRKRNGDVSTEDRYILFEKALDILKKNKLVALVDIKEKLAKKNKEGACIGGACDCDPNTDDGRKNMKKSWLNTMQKCYEIASRKGMLDYIAFKTAFTYEDITSKDGIPEKYAGYVRFMPMVQRPNPVLGWDKEGKRSIALVDSWVSSNVSNNIVAIETNFNSPEEAIFPSLTKDEYVNILHYVVSKGFRPGIFAEEPVGVRGVSDRWGKWHMPDSKRNIRANHLLLMEVPYFQTAVVTTDRPEIWKQISSPLRSSNTSGNIENSNITRMDNVALTEITAKYRMGSIIIDGLDKNDVGSYLMLYDLQGRLIYKDRINIYPQMITTKSLQAGVYILRISGNRQTSIKLLINQ
jgi:hypothetical protein